jgi:lipopolysaccharide/colanic/teichoic acid biosynthesis glycosyltransferase
LAKRFFDIVFSALGLIILSPVFLLIAIAIILESRGAAIYKQLRVGLNNKGFILFKFRTMKTNSDKNLQLTVGNNDTRITKLGRFLRRFKIDELPQLYNVLKGEMSFVGPRPEVPKYVSLYTASQMQVLSVKPGITDYASIKFRNENELLAKSDSPEEYYIKELMPHKLGLNLFYVKHQSFLLDMKLIFKTIILIFVKIK